MRPPELDPRLGRLLVELGVGGAHSRSYCIGICCIHLPADMVLVRREEVSPNECVGEEGRGREESG